MGWAVSVWRGVCVDCKEPVLGGGEVGSYPRPAEGQAVRCLWC